jgi:hypothetical protein
LAPSLGATAKALFDEPIGFGLPLPETALATGKQDAHSVAKELQLLGIQIAKELGEPLVPCAALGL